MGYSSSALPFLALMAALATLLGGKPWLAIDLILLGCVPLAGVSPFPAVRRGARFAAGRGLGPGPFCLLAGALGPDAPGPVGPAGGVVPLPAAFLPARQELD